MTGRVKEKTREIFRDGVSERRKDSENILSRSGQANTQSKAMNEFKVKC